MHFLNLGLLILAVGAVPAFAEIVQTTDGRSIELKEDGTYQLIEKDEQSDGAFVEHKDPYFVHHAGEYKQNKVRFMPVFENISDKKIVGIKFTARFHNAFGDELFKFSGETDEPIPPGRTSKHNLFYYFEDNQFISGEPYDKLLPMVTNKSGKINVSLNMIAFEGGDIVKLSD